MSALQDMTLRDYFWALELAVRSGSRGMRATGFQHRCPQCDEQVPVIEDNFPRLTSSGETTRWVKRHADAHRRECMDAVKDRLAGEVARLDLDLWAS